MPRLGRSTPPPPPPKPEDIVGVALPLRATEPAPEPVQAVGSYHVELLLHAEQFLKSTIQEMFQVRRSLWLPKEQRDGLRHMERQNLEKSKGRFRAQIRGLVGALRLVRYARKAGALEILGLLQANAMGWVEDSEVAMEGQDWVKRGDVEVRFQLPAGRWMRAGKR